MTKCSELSAALAALQSYEVAHRKGEMEGRENRPLYSVPLTIVRHSAWVAGYGWPDYEAPFVTGPTILEGDGSAELIATLRLLAAECSATKETTHDQS